MKLIIKNKLSSVSIILDVDELIILQLVDFLKNFCGNSYQINIDAKEQPFLLGKKFQGKKSNIKNKNGFEYFLHSDDAEII